MNIKTTARLGPMGGGTYAQRAKERWGLQEQAWVRVLARAADGYAAEGKSMVALGAFLGVNPSVLNAVIGKTYRGRYDHVEQVVLGKLMSQSVLCPALGMSVARDTCAANQRRKSTSCASPLTARFPKSCKGCPNAFGDANA